MFRVENISKKGELVLRYFWNRTRMRLLPLMLVLTISIVVVLLVGDRLLDKEALLVRLLEARDSARNSGIFFLISFAFVYAAAVALSMPVALLLTISGGFLFGWIPGATIGIFSKTVGSLLLFLIARYGLADFARRSSDPRLAAIGAYIDSDSFLCMLGMRLQPVVPFFIVNLAAALFKVRMRTFVLATIAGIAPGAFISSLAGQEIARLVEKNYALQLMCREGDNSACGQLVSLATFWSPTAFVLLLSLALLSLAPVVIKHWRRS